MRSLILAPVSSRWVAGKKGQVLEGSRRLSVASPVHKGGYSSSLTDNAEGMPPLTSTMRETLVYLQPLPGRRLTLLSGEHIILPMLRSSRERWHCFNGRGCEEGREGEARFGI